MTLTVNPAVGNSPEERRAALAHAFNLLIHRLRRLPKYSELEYACVVERTEQGEPHLHVLLRSAFIPQALISDAMKELIDAPIVDIRAVRKRRDVISYVAKYVTKAPARFEGFKRYWFSRHYDLSEWAPEANADGLAVPWQLLRQDIHSVTVQWLHEGWTARRDGDDTLRFVPIENWGLFWGGP